LATANVTYKVFYNTSLDVTGQYTDYTYYDNCTGNVVKSNCDIEDNLYFPQTPTYNCSIYSKPTCDDSYTPTCTGVDSTDTCVSTCFPYINPVDHTFDYNCTNSACT
jgi:hypothetical protein